MKMVPAQQNLHSPSYGAFSCNLYPQSFNLMSRFQEDESTTNGLHETPSSSKDVADGGDKGWLRLSIGAAGDPDAGHKRRDREKELTELDLLPAGGGSSKLTPLVLTTPGPEVNWGFRPMSENTGITTSSPSCSSFIPLGSYCTTAFQLHSDTMRLIDPPRRPHTGIWFTLQPLENQGKKPVVPQGSSSYLRIKDGRMTVRLLIKYLVNKLRLDSESEIEIRCRGEKLEECLTMQHIRDKIWCSSNSNSNSKPQHSLTLLPHSSTIDHLMVLHYATSPPHSSS